MTSSVCREERNHAGRAAVGEATARGPADPSVRLLAAGRAWEALATGLLEDEQLEDGYAAARLGLDEVGDAYDDLSFDDDTSLKLLAAEDLYERGEANAAAAMIRVLRTRLQLLAERVEPEG